MLPALFWLTLVVQDPGGMDPVTAGGIEGRPSPAATSPLQARIDRAEPGEVIRVAAGTYSGDLVIDRPVRLVGEPGARLLGSGEGSVVRVRSDDVTVEGFDIDGRYGGSLMHDSSGVHVAARRATIRRTRIARAFFGIYLRDADDAVVEGNTVHGEAGRDAGEQGSGIHVYNSQRFRLMDNDLRHVRDGIYIQSSSGGFVRGNVARDLRYGLHYMYADDNVFEDNRFEDGAAGAAIMYSRRVAFRRNRFLHNRGYASVGLLLKDCEDAVAEDNLIADNARGIFVDGAVNNAFRRNVVAESDVAVVMFASNSGVRFEGNTFLANLSPLQLVGRRTDAVFDGNYWSDASAPDLDGDGIRDSPHRLTSVFDHLRGNLTAADLVVAGFAARALAVAEQAFPVLAPVPVADARPLARPPDHGRVPVSITQARKVAWPGLTASAACLAGGLAVVAWGRRSRGPRPRR